MRIWIMPRHLFAASLSLASGQALAQAHIGGAVVVHNDVRGQTQGKTLAIAQGDRVFQNELVRTGADSLAKFMLLDETNVSLGPSSQLTLDKFVYDPQAGAKQVTIGAAKGAFRFISGKSPHEAYEVRTPQATIGVRGTTYDVRVENGRTIVVLQEGAVHVCRRNTQICSDLTQPGESLVISDRSMEGPIAPGGKIWDFGSLCGASNELCGKITQFAFNETQRATSTQRRQQATKVEPEAPRRQRVVTVEPKPQPKVTPRVRRQIVEIAEREPPKRLRLRSQRDRYVQVERPQHQKQARRLVRVYEQARRPVRIYEDFEPDVIADRRPRVAPLAIGIGLGILRFGGLGGGGRGYGAGPMRGNLGFVGR